MTTREILKQTGLTDDQINALDAKILTGFDTVLTTAATEREAAELASRAQRELYDQQIAPALDQWGNEKAILKATAAFYKTQAEAAKGAGFIPEDAPGYVPPKDPGTGQFVAGGNVVPGSPGFTPAQGITAISNATWAFQEHARLFNQPAPDDFETLLNEATAQKLPFRDYVSRKYKFVEKKAEISAAAAKAHDDKLIAETEARMNKKYAEENGNNPGVRVGQPSQYAKVAAAVTEGKRKDPLKMNAEERRANTRSMINQDLADNAAATIN